MGTEQTDVIIIGGGQAGLALSYYLTEQRREHVILEQGRIAESWCTKRWDSLCLMAAQQSQAAIMADPPGSATCPNAAWRIPRGH